MKRLLIVALVASTIYLPVLAQKKGADDFNDLIRRYYTAWSTLNPDNASFLYAKDASLVFFDIAPLKYSGGWQEYRDNFKKNVAPGFSSLTLAPNSDLKVTRRGNIALTTLTFHMSAKQKGVKHFVLISFPEIDLEFPLQSAKRAAEEHLRQSGMTYTILQPACFSEVWLSRPLGFDIANAKARIYGKGESKISWISFQDVAKFAAAALDAPAARNAVIQLGGPEALSPLEVVKLAEEITGKQFTIEHVPEDAIRAQYQAATDPMEKSVAALMLFYAGGSAIDMTETLRVLLIRPLKAVREHLQASVAVGHSV